MSAAQFARLEVGLTSDGLQIWCTRHDREVGTLTPEQLATMVEEQPPCECCPGGKHLS